MSDKKHNKQERARRQCVRLWRMHKDGMTVREIAAIFGKTAKSVSRMLKIGERFAE